MDQDSNTLFRLVALRGVRPLNNAKSIDLRNPLETSFQLSLAKLDSLNEMIGEAKKYADSDAYTKLVGNRELRELFADLKDHFSQHSGKIPPSALEDFVKTASQKHKDLLKATEALFGQVADVFIASSYAGATWAKHRELFQGFLRCLNIVILLRKGKPAPAAMFRTSIILPAPLQGIKNRIRPAGIGDLLIVEQKLLGYRRSEIAHVENVMASESRTRQHRKLDRMTETYTVESENTQETTRDLQTTDRSELSTDMSRSLSEEMGINLDTSISGKYGPTVSIEVNAGISYSTAKEESEQTTSSLVKEVIDNSITKVTQRDFSSITTVTLTESEEINGHSFENNHEDAEHIVGIYRWLDQEWEAQVFNYGRRLMMEFNVPQPAAFWRWAQLNAVKTPLSDMPMRPTPFNYAPHDIDATGTSPTSYTALAKAQGAVNLDPPPAEEYNISTSLVLPETAHGKLSGSDYDVKTQQGTLVIPDGYEATFVRMRSTQEKFLKDNNDAKSRFQIQVASLERDLINGEGEGPLTNVRGALSISAFAYDYTAATIGIRVTVKRTDEAYQAWQLDCWKKLKDANTAANSAYEAAIKIANNQAQSKAAELSPSQKRLVERDELKRGSLNILTGSDFGVLDPVTSDEGSDLPKIDVDKSLQHGRYLSFFEQGFEWAQMTYLFYPYFWGEKDLWSEHLDLTEDDPLFAAFLKAGSSRVQIPVRPGFERAILFYLATGEIWHGNDVPIIGDPLHLPIAAEISESLDRSLTNAVPYGEPWTFSIPTSLVALDDDLSIIK